VQPAAEAVGAEVVTASQMRAGDIELRWEGEVVGGFRPASLDGALDRMIAAVERELGHPADDLDREQKQEFVRRLDELGAFTLRRSVEDVAEVLRVSRFTVYNYLNALQQDR
jgi:hypothetical protein